MGMRSEKSAYHGLTRLDSPLPLPPLPLPVALHLYVDSARKHTAEQGLFNVSTRYIDSSASLHSRIECRFVDPDAYI